MSVHIIDRGNDALDVNSPNADRNLTVGGSDWLWAVTAVMGITFLSWLVWTLLRNKARTASKSHIKADNNHGVSNNLHNSAASSDRAQHHSERIFHYLFTLAAFIGFISYFTMASDLGNTPVRQYMNIGANAQQTRQVFYVRYIYWFVAWPMLVVANLLLSGVSWATIFFAVVLQETWVICWLCAALVTTSYKWGFFAFGVFAYIVLAYLLLSWGTGHARRIRTEKDYTLLASLLVVIWVAFPIAWGLSEGSNRLSVTGEMIFYGILDMITLPLYGTMFLLLSNRFGHSLFPFTQTGRVMETAPQSVAQATFVEPLQGGV